VLGESRSEKFYFSIFWFSFKRRKKWTDDIFVKSKLHVQLQLTEGLGIAINFNFDFNLIIKTLYKKIN